MDKQKAPLPAAEFTLDPPAALMPTLRLDRTATGEFGSDFSLPDYLPEIKRLLRVTAAPLPESRYVSGSGVEYAGAVEYLVCYAGADGALWSSRLRQDYNFNLPIDADLLAEGIEPHADLTVDSVVSRVTAPRKLNIRCRMRCRVRGWGEEDISPRLEGAPSPGVIERLTKPAHGMVLCRASAGPIDLGDEIIPPGGEGQGEIRVVSADGAALVEEAAAADGAVNCRGELCLRVILAAEADQPGALPMVIERRIPFAESIAMPEVTASMQARAWGRCGDLAVSVEDGRVLCDASLWLEAEAAADRELEAVADLYATDGEMADCVYREIEPVMLVRCTNVGMTVGGTLSAKEAGIDPAAQILDVSASPQIEGMEWKQGRAVLSGSCRYNLLCLSDGEYAPVEVSLPFVCEIDCGGNQPTDREAELICLQARARLEGEGEQAKLTLDGQLRGAVRLTARRKCRVLSRALYRPLEPDRTSGCTVCYPERDESLWVICKRYRIPHRTLEAANSLKITADADQPESLEGVRYLIF